MKNRRFLRISLPLAVAALLLALAAFGAVAQGDVVSAAGTFSGEQQNPGGYELSMSGKMDLTFYRSGGPAVGMLAAETVRSGDGTLLEHFFNLALNGNFQGFPGGEIGGSMSGLFTDKYVADELHELQLLICAFDYDRSDPACDDPAPDYDAHTLDVSGSWQGQLDRGGGGSGTFEINVPAYSVGENTFQAMNIRGTWEVSGITMGGTAPVSVISVEDFIPGAIPLLHRTSLPTSQVPAFVIVGGLGALAGLWLSRILADAFSLGVVTSQPSTALAHKRTKSGVERVWGERTQVSTEDAPPGQARSPVDGRLVSIEQAHHEEALLNTGYRYDRQNDAFIYDHEKAAALRADPSSPMSQALKDEIERAEALRAQRIHEQTAWQEQDYRKHMAEIERCHNAIMALKTAEFLANAGVSTAAHYIPLAGPIIETAYDEIKTIASTESSTYDQDSTARLQEIIKKPFYIAFRDRFKIQAESTSQKVLVIMLDQVFDEDQEVAVNLGFDAIIDRGTQLITGNP